MRSRSGLLASMISSSTYPFFSFLSWATGVTRRQLTSLRGTDSAILSDFRCCGGRAPRRLVLPSVGACQKMVRWPPSSGGVMEREGVGEKE